MNGITVDPQKFSFYYLPDYANYLLHNRLEEFVTVGIRFCREAQLPLLKALDKMSERELVALSMETNRQMLHAIGTHSLAAHIRAGIAAYVSNTIGYIDQADLAAEDLTLGFHLRRKIFAYFLDGYTKNLVLQKLIIAEVDQYTTQEELIAYSIFIKIQNERLTLHTDLLLETQKLAGIGSYYIDIKDRARSMYTPEYLKIIE